MNLPAKVSPGEQVRAEDFNALIDAIRAATISPGTGYVRRITPSGTTLRIRQATPREQRTDFAPFAVRDAADDGMGNYELTLEPGRVRSSNPVQAANDGDGWDYFVPTINGTAMDEKDVDGKLPTVAVTNGEAVYCKIERDPEGVVVGTPEIVVMAPDEESTHYQPVNPLDSGVEEKFQYARILEASLVDGELEIKYWRKSDIELINQLWAGENLGSGGEHFKKHQADIGRWQFRNSNGKYGIDARTEGDQVDIDFDAENLENLTGGTNAEVFVDPGAAPIPEGKAQFRPLTQGVSGRKQIEVNQDGDVIRINGNGANGSLTWTDCDGNSVELMAWTDGLVTTVGGATIVAGCPSTGGS